MASGFVRSTMYAPLLPTLPPGSLMTDVDNRLSTNTFRVISYYFRSIENLHGYLRQEDQPSSKFQYTQRPIVVI